MRKCSRKIDSVTVLAVSVKLITRVEVEATHEATMATALGEPWSVADRGTGDGRALFGRH